MTSPTNAGGVRKRAARTGEGRPTKCTPEMRARILEHIALGSPLEVCCYAAGVTSKTLYTWIKRAETQASQGLTTVYTQFLHDIKQVEADAVARWLKTLDLAALDPKNWAAMAWKLERRLPQFFALKRETPAVQINVLVGELTQQLKQLIPDPQQRLQIAEALAQPSVVRDESAH